MTKNAQTTTETQTAPVDNFVDNDPLERWLIPEQEWVYFTPAPHASRAADE